MTDREEKLEQVCRCALADLEGIMPMHESSGGRKHLAWQTIEELREILGKGILGEEFIISLVDGRTLRCPPYPIDCRYMRICDQDGKELHYWHFEEFERDLKLFLGALMAAIGNPDEERDDGQD